MRKLIFIFLLWLSAICVNAQEIQKSVDTDFVHTPVNKNESQRGYTIKTNFIGLGMAIFNLTSEFDLGPHWSIALPVYYSGGYDYLKPTIKFRILSFQPEFRYYVCRNDGFYLGAHFGAGIYNYALGGEYRIQDYKGERPAYGGGLGVGYSFNFKKYPRWGMEFSIGGGVYDVKYDVFYNEVNGVYAEHGIEDIYIGVDNAAISLTYKIPYKKEGGQ